MSEINEQLENNEPATMSAKRNVKLTAKALGNKIESLQKERKTHVNKIKGLIPEMKEHMKRNENVQKLDSQLKTFTQLLDTAVNLHQTIIPLLPEDEKVKQDEWFSSIEKYSSTFKDSVMQWLDERAQTSNTARHNVVTATKDVWSFQMEDPSRAATQDKCPITPHEGPQDDVKPSDSISNVQSRRSAQSAASGKSSGSGKKSGASSTSSARIKAEADLAALMARQRLLQDKHALEEEEQQIRKRREKLELDEEIAAHLAKVTVLRAASTSGSRDTATDQSNAMNSYLNKEQRKTTKFNIEAAPFNPQRLETYKQQPNIMVSDLVTRPKADKQTQPTYFQPLVLKHNLSEPNCQSSTHHHHHHQTPHGTTLNTESSADNGEQTHVLDIMKRQNDITTLLMQQQQRSYLPKRDIQVFDGDPLQYHTFMRAFENGVESKSDCYSDCLYFLEQFTRGRPRDLVRSCQHMDPERGYAQAKVLLQEHFGDEQRIAAAYMDKALSWTPIKSEDVKALQDYSLFLRGCSNAMNEVQYMFEMDMPANMLMIVKKLPYKLRDRWRTNACEIQERRNQRATFNDIVHFIERQVKMLTDPVFGDIQDTIPALSRGTNRTTLKPRSKSKGSFATTVMTADNNNTLTKGRKPDMISSGSKVCLFCEGGHTLEFCPRLEKRAHTEKITFLRGKGVCFGCLCTGHISKDCRRRLSCKVCDLKHPTMLHIYSKEKESVTGEEPGAAVGCALVSSGLTGAGDQCRLPIVPVQIKSKKGNHTVLTYAFLDQGSTAVFCTVNLMNKLNLSGKRTRILLRTMGQEKVVNSHVVSGLEVAGLDGESYCDLPDTYTQECMPVHKGNIPCQNDLLKWAYLKDVHLPQIDSEVELLIGTNVPRALEPLQVIRSMDNGPYAVKTMLGWIVNGPLGGDSGDGIDVVNVNRISVLNLEELWKQQFKTDFPECSYDEQPGHSREDQRFMKLVQDSTRLVHGHYQVPLPLKTNCVNMPNNKKVAEQRALNLRKRFERDPTFRQQYTDFMNEMVTKGYAEQVPSGELVRDDGKVWYIPHHGVYHPQKGKIRVVFDCAASFQSMSLNDQLLQGPDLTNSLIGVLVRFRMEPVVITADIESMFHQVRVPKEDVDLLRFLWWPNGDFFQDLVDFRMLVHLFGATSSPSCANFALRKCAEDNKDQFCPETIEKLRHCFYVDDCLVSTASEEEAVALYHDLVSICSKGGFKLTKWMSNRRAVMAEIPEDQRARGIKDLDLDHDVVSVERVLGVQWCIRSDAFKFKIVVQDRPLTRRGILSVISSIYDPLGILSPVVLSAKIILQELCRQQLGWDDPIPPSAAKEWINWLKELHQLEHFQVARCLKPPDFGEVTAAQLHHFTDASENGYGTVTYLLFQDAYSHMHSSFVMGKSRVSPLKSVSIPRMELTAATMASRLDTFWKKELHLSLKESMFWTDSTSVLKYIRNETSRFRTFVANRVSEILKTSQPSQWRYVNTLTNPADVASRGLKADMLLRSETWLSGPAYLLQPEQDWPVSPECFSELQPDDPEVKVSVAVNALQSSENVDATTRLIHHFSSWTRLRRAVAWIIRLKNLLQWLSQKRKQSDTAPTLLNSKEQQCPFSEQESGVAKDPVIKGLLTVDELCKAEKEIIRFCQRTSFSDELSSLQSGRNVKRSSHIFKLSPVLEDGILRVGGRLSRAALPEEAKHPAILSKDHHISSILLRHIHQQVGHGGRNYILAKLRQRYWIPGVGTAIRRILSKCVICRRLQAAPGCQLMADLPVDRVCPDEAPFTRVGVDYFGPFEVKSRRSVVKRYGVIFTCLAIRAIHIEVASSLDTDSFINALRRFIARRGQVKEIRSDNGTNFVGGERELREAIRGWNQAQINDALLQKEIKWVFNPPAGSHHGGAWERLIRSVRKILNSIFKVQTLDEEGLHTVLCEIEAIINGRPITKASLDPNDLEALTPNHLLLLKTTPSLPPGEFQSNDTYALRRWRQVQYMSDLFWKRWTKEYLPQLQERQKWTGTKRNFAVGDIVLIVDETAPRNSWIMGKVIQIFPDRRGFVRRLLIKTKTSSLERPITKVCLLQEAEA